MTKVTEFILVALCAALVLFFHAVAYAQQSTTCVGPVDKTGKTWRVEISRQSLQLKSDLLTDRSLNSTIESLMVGFAKPKSYKVSSAGFLWAKPLKEDQCQIYAINNGRIDKDKPLAFIPFDNGKSCFENASRLRSAIARLRTAGQVIEVNRRGKGPLALGPQLALMETVLFSDLAQHSEAHYFSPLDVVDLGYRVMKGDTLSGIAKKLTGRASYWKQLSVVGGKAQSKPNNPHLIFPADRVRLSEPMAKALLLSSMPGQLFATAEVDLKWRKIGLKLDGDVLRSLKSMNNLLLNNWKSTTGLTPQGIWVPNMNVGWQEIQVDARDPISISKAAYGSADYEVFVAALCPTTQSKLGGNYILPKFGFSTDLGRLRWLKNGDDWRGVRLNVKE